MSARQISNVWRPGELCETAHGIVRTAYVRDLKRGDRWIMRWNAETPTLRKIVKVIYPYLLQFKDEATGEVSVAYLHPHGTVALLVEECAG